jgi:SAM-dependent methyltransferase
VEASFEQHRSRRNLFTNDVDAYDDGRPGYPDEVYRLLREVCGLAAGSVVLEIGPGTGQATGALLDNGATVTAVEMGPGLAERLRAKFAGRSLTVVVDAFEHVAFECGSFDIVAAATSFHWVPPEQALSRCAEILRPNGWIALWWNHFGDPARPDPFHEALVPILRRRAPELLDPASAGNAGADAHPYALDTDARTAEIDRTGAFGPVRRETVSWTGRHTAREIRTLFASFSPWLALDPEPREAVLDDLEALAHDLFGGVVERPYLTPVYLAQRLSTDRGR